MTLLRNIDEDEPASTPRQESRGPAVIDRSDSKTSLPGGVSYERQSAPRLNVKTPKPSVLDRGLSSLVSLLELHDSYTSVERSNAFDDWKEAVDASAADGERASTAHRQILGFLLIATRRRDVVDFTLDQLRAFREVTNIVRQVSVFEQDVERAMRLLKQAEALRALPLSVADLPESAESELDEILEALRSQ